VVTCIALALPYQLKKDDAPTPPSHSLDSSNASSTLDLLPIPAHCWRVPRPQWSKSALLVHGNPPSNRSSHGTPFGGRSPCHILSAELDSSNVTPRSGKSGKHLSNYHILLPVEGVVCSSATYQMHVRASTAHRLTIANRTVPYRNITLHARIQRATTPPGLCA
jgi:hypothetical protein